MFHYYTSSEKESIKDFKTSIRVARKDMRKNNAEKDRALYKHNDILLKTLIQSQMLEVRAIKRKARRRLMNRLFKRK